MHLSSGNLLYTKTSGYLWGSYSSGGFSIRSRTSFFMFPDIFLNIVNCKLLIIFCFEHINLGDYHMKTRQVIMSKFIAYASFKYITESEYIPEDAVTPQILKESVCVHEVGVWNQIVTIFRLV